MAGTPATPAPAVRVAWRPEQFNWVSNPGFETNTTGWAVTAGINAAATSITRITTDKRSGTACASVVCTATDGSGVNHDFGAARFYDEGDTGAVYVATGWVKRVSGSTRLRITLGSEGTATDRATLTLTDLPDAWVPFRIKWLPLGNRTDVQLAITNGSAQALTFLLDDVTVCLSDALSQVENGHFEVDTTGWGSFLGGSIARSTAEYFAAVACARVSSVATQYSGAVLDMSGRTFVGGRTYRLRLAAKLISGNSTWFAQIASVSTDSASVDIAATSSFRWYTVDYTPAADRRDVNIRIGNGTTTPSVLAVDEVEVYEASDDLGTDAGDLTWSRSLDAIGTASVRVRNSSGTYDPRNASSALYGSVAPGKRIHIRSVYGGALYANFYGVLTTVEPDPDAGTVDLLAEDMLGTIRDADVSADFLPDESVSKTRSYIIDCAVTDLPSTITAPSSAAHESLAHGLEDNTFYRGSDGNVSALDLLAEINEATQSVHWVKPSPHAMIGWVYTVVDRATLTDTAAGWGVNEGYQAAEINGVRVTHEALANRVEVPWQGYDPLPPKDADDTGSGTVAIAYDPDVHGDLGMGEEGPYLSYTREEYGTDDDHPEPRWRYPAGLTAQQWRRRKKRGLKVKRRTRVFPDSLVPFRMATGDVRQLVIDFAVPVANLAFSWSGLASDANFLADTIEVRPNRLVVDLRCLSADTITKVVVTGRPHVAGDELTFTADAYDSQALYGVRSDTSVGSAYVASEGDAAGVARYRAWRWGAPRLRPTVVETLNFPRTMTADLTDHVTLTADRWNLSNILLVVTEARWSVTAGGLSWRREMDLEELPSHTAWFILDTSTLDGANVLAY